MQTFWNFLRDCLKISEFFEISEQNQPCMIFDISKLVWWIAREISFTQTNKLTDLRTNGYLSVLSFWILHPSRRVKPSKIGNGKFARWSKFPTGNLKVKVFGSLKDISLWHTLIEIDILSFWFEVARKGQGWR